MKAHAALPCLTFECQIENNSPCQKNITLLELFTLQEETRGEYVKEPGVERGSKNVELRPLSQPPANHLKSRNPKTQNRSHTACENTLSHSLDKKVF